MKQQYSFGVSSFARVGLIAGALLVLMPSPARAGYSFEGYDFTKAEMETMKSGLERAQVGVEALGRRDWVTAGRECRAGYDAFTGVGMPAVGKAASFYVQVKACMADAFAAQGIMDRACKWYGNNNYVSLIYSNPRQVCADYERGQ
jgi:hypothetical protein